MSDASQPPPPTDPKRDSDRERTKQVEVAGWTAGLSAFFALATLSVAPTWPMALAVVAVVAMVAVVCFFILKR